METRRKHKVERDKEQSIDKDIQKSRERGMNRLMQYYFLHQKREANCSISSKTYLCVYMCRYLPVHTHTYLQNAHILLIVPI